MSKKRLHYAQVQTLQWLQSRIEDQFVKAYISTEIQLFEKRKKTPKVLPGQMDIMEALDE